MKIKENGWDIRSDYKDEVIDFKIEKPWVLGTVGGKSAYLNKETGEVKMAEAPFGLMDISRRKVAAERSKRTVKEFGGITK